MPMFRKKPVEIEARQLFSDNTVEIGDWCGGFSGSRAVVIPTLEGEMRAELGDWIIRGIKGEFYPCKPDIFEASYEEVK